MSTDNGLPSSQAAADATASAEPRRASPPAPIKRRASSASLSDARAASSPKRTRLGAADEAATAGSPPPKPPASSSPPPPPGAGPRRAAPSKEEEKKRSRRLFGGLLNTLSQTTSSSQQKRRQEIERRQQAKASQRRADDDKERAEKRAKLSEVRKREQIKFEEQAMQSRHSHLTATARFLKTRAEPPIFYLPWELTAAQENRVRDQIRDAEDLVERESREFKQRREQRLKDLGLRSGSSPAPGDERASAGAAREAEEADSARTVGKVDSDAHPSTQPESTNGDASAPPSKAGGTDKDPDEADNEADNVVIEGDEDTLIY